MDKITFVKKTALWVAIIAAVIILLLGIFTGHVIEGSLFAEVMKWIAGGVVVIAILEGFVAILAPLVWHWTYGKKEEKK